MGFIVSHLKGKCSNCKGNQDEEDKMIFHGKPLFFI
jgi:hypothetical protein